MPIAQLGEPVLRAVAQPIADYQSLQLHNLIEDMLVTVAHAHGVGLAAPQVSESLRVFIVSSRPNQRYRHAPFIEPFAMINPTIVAQSTEIERDWEGCLSISGLRGFVPRHKSITIAFHDRHGQEHEAEFHDFVARVIQHEYDHLEGIVFLDRLESPDDVVTEAEWERMQSLQLHPPESTCKKN